MTTEATTAAAGTVETTRKKREKRSWNVVLTSPDGRAAKVTASKKGDGAKVYVIHSTPKANGKRLNERGATDLHPTIEAAKAQQEKVVALLLKKGWTVKPVQPRGFVAKPDAFDINNLPSASAAAPAKSSKKK